MKGKLGHIEVIWNKGAFTYDVSSRGGGGFKILKVADKGGRGLSLAEVSKNT